MVDSNNLVKGIFIAIAFLEALIMGLIPVLNKRFKESPKILGVANAFSGGVFLAICLMHIMPEQVDSFNELKSGGDDPEMPQDDDDEGAEPFPVPYMVLVIGYTLILTIDKVLFDTHAIFDDAHNHHGQIKDEYLMRDPNLKRA